MKKLLTLLFLFLVFNAFSQQTSEKSNRFQMGVNLSPDLGYRTLIKQPNGAADDFVRSSRNEIETMKPGFTTGLHVCYNFKNGFGLEAGLQYSNKGYQTKEMDVFSNLPIDRAIPDKIKRIYNFNSIDIPLRAIVMFGEKKFRFFASLGLTTNIFIKQTETTILIFSNPNKRETNTNDLNLNKLTVSGTASFGFDYQLNNQMNLRLEPTFRHGLTPIAGTGIKEYLFSGGLNLGYYYKI